MSYLSTAWRQSVSVEKVIWRYVAGVGEALGCSIQDGFTKRIQLSFFDWFKITIEQKLKQKMD